MPVQLERLLELVEDRKEIDAELLVERNDIVLFDEGKLHVNLSEFRLPVCPEVLVPEAPDNLEIPVKACNHQQLL